MNDVWVLGLSTGANASTCLLKNGEIVFYIEEERLSRIKGDSKPFLGLLEAVKYTDRIDYFIQTNDTGIVNSFDSPYVHLLVKLGLYKPKKELKNINIKNNHHLYHATGGFYNSGFDEAVCVVIDSVGANVEFDGHSGLEIESVYIAEKPCNFISILKRCGNNSDIPYHRSEQYEFINTAGIGTLYSGLSNMLGHGNECGKSMGLSSYGKEDNQIPFIQSLYEKTDDYSKPSIKNFEDYNKENLSLVVQRVTQRMAMELIAAALQNSDSKNLVICGSYALNCVANYEYLKYLPSDVNVYIDPPSSDAGLSIGAAKYMYNYALKENAVPQTKLSSLYIGPLPSYDFSIPAGYAEREVSYADIATVLSDGECVSIFQGRSEAGPRALGNRSILFDPRNKNGKDIVNRIKNREWFRPFAGSIMSEHSHEWFDMRGLEESPFMMYAVNVLEEKKHIIPAITHVDGTCRVQTVTKEQNLHFYRLIESFYKITNVPILFNTSFNLAGEPLVETIQDALDTLSKSEINYLYLPEINKLVYKL